MKKSRSLNPNQTQFTARRGEREEERMAGSLGASSAGGF
jgi:hypothetical protein